MYHPQHSEYYRFQHKLMHDVTISSGAEVGIISKHMMNQKEVIVRELL